MLEVDQGLKVKGSKAAQRYALKMGADFTWSTVLVSEAAGHCNPQKSGWAEIACRS